MWQKKHHSEFLAFKLHTTPYFFFLPLSLKFLVTELIETILLEFETK